MVWDSVLIMIEIEKWCGPTCLLDCISVKGDATGEASNKHVTVEFKIQESNQYTTSGVLAAD